LVIIALVHLHHHHHRKSHAVTGNLLALFMIEVLEGAIYELVTTKDSIDDVWKRVRAEDNNDRKIFANANIPDMLDPSLPFDLNPDLKKEIIFGKTAMCHTGILPAEIRHLGLLSVTSRKKGFYDFEPAMLRSVADSQENPTDEMRLVMDDNSRQVCDEILEMDYKDYFYLSQKEGKKKLALPNMREKKYYKSTRQLEGIIMLCFGLCSWGKCPAGDIRPEHIAEGKVKMDVNGQDVAGVTPYGTCAILQHKTGHKFTANSEGVYEISAVIKEENNYMRLLSVIIW
jgi:hypothetical protein